MKYKSVFDIIGPSSSHTAGAAKIGRVARNLFRKKRNAMGAANAMVAADMALGGITSRIPCDEVIGAGQAMPVALRETAKGGLAATPTGKALEAKIYGAASYK